MIHAFILVLLLGDVKQGGQPMLLKNINDCNYFASRVVRVMITMEVPKFPKNTK